MPINIHINWQELLHAKAYYEPLQFAIWRICFGLYLAYYFLRMLPYAAEIYSNQGVLPDAIMSSTYPYFPGIFAMFDAPTFIENAHLVLALLSCCIAFGFFRRTSALIVWYGTASLVHRNYLALDPSLAFIGWLLLALTIVPSGEPLSATKKNSDWYMPAGIYWGALFTMGLAYTASGLDRLFAQSWQDGSAVRHLFELPIAHDWFIHDLMLALPDWIFILQSYFAAGMFVAALPLLLWSKTRMVGWVVLTLMFVYIGFILELTQVILGLILFHAFIFDARWLGKRFTVQTEVKRTT